MKFVLILFIDCFLADRGEFIEELSDIVRKFLDL